MKFLSPLILASASPRRVELLGRLGITPEAILPADCDETPLKAELPRVYVARIAREKAHVIAARASGKNIIAADTIVVLGRRILPKAEDETTARECLALLSGRRHRVMTSVCVITANGQLRQKTAETVVKFSALTKPMTEAYIASGEWNGKAGGYGIQGLAGAFIPFISGSHSTVMGLPLFETAQLLRA